jgi:ABC-type transport system involved in multi-copper enzyme maturation permease subunit
MTTGEVKVLEAAAPRVTYESSSLHRVSAIALNTFRESVRDRVLYNLVLFVLILVAASVFVSDLSLDMESQFTAALGLSVMLVFGALIAIFIGVGLVYKEIDKRTIYNLLSKPVHRQEFLIGKYLGLCMTLLVNSIVMVAGTELALLYVNRGFAPIELAVLPAAYMIFLELALLVGIAIMFSSFTTPMLSALFSFAAYMIGHFSRDLLEMAALSNSIATRLVLTALYYLLPNLSNFGFISEASHARIASMKMVASATAYGILYVAILLSAAVLIFKKRNFK